MKTNKEEEPINNGFSEMKKFIDKTNKIDFNEGEDMKIPIIIFVLFMPTNCILLEYIYYFDVYRNSNNIFEYKLSVYFMIFIYIMIIFSYKQCFSIKNYVPMRKPPTNENYSNVKTNLNNKICDSCKNWRPNRAIHCISCKKCVLRYDHHCPWIFNCVGLKNHKAFFLFCLYLLLGSLQYGWNLLKFLFFINDNLLYSNYSTIFYIYLIFINFIIFPMTLMFIGLTGFHFLLALQNFTSNDPFENDILKLPCFPKNINFRKRNIYDLGWINNLLNFFGKSYFFFWLPTEITYENDGTIYPSIPNLSCKEIQEDIGIDEIYYTPQKIAQRKFDFDNYLKKIEEEHKNSNFKINDKIFEFWKKKALEEDKI